MDYWMKLDFPTPPAPPTGSPPNTTINPRPGHSTQWAAKRPRSALCQGRNLNKGNRTNRTDRQNRENKKNRTNINNRQNRMDILRKNRSRTCVRERFLRKVIVSVIFYECYARILLLPESTTTSIIVG